MKIKLADFVISYLADLNVDKIFVVYGAANGDLIDAFSRTNKTQYVAIMHEQAGGFAAEGYAKVKEKNIPGVTIATSGPGGMNLVTPIGNFYYDSTPGIFITGQINSQFMRPDPQIRQVGFQETDIVEIVKPITKYAKLIKDPETIKYELEYAYHIATTGRPGPVLLDIPMDVQKKIIESDKLYGFDQSSIRSITNYDSLEKKIKSYLNDLKNAKRPVILVGGGVRTANAIDHLFEIGKALKIPMYPTWNALDVVTSDYEYYCGRVGTFGGAGRNFGIQNSDLLLAIGSRISGRITGGNIHTFARSAKKYVVDIDESLLQKKLQQVPFDENILCDAKFFIDSLHKAFLKEKMKPSLQQEQWLKQCIEWKKNYDPVKPEFFKEQEYVHPYAFIRKLSELMTQEDVLVADCGGNIVVCNHAFETKKGQRYFTNNGNSPMGFSFAAGIGACFAAPNKNVVCVIGDGGMNMNIQELKTIKNYKLKLKTIILNNHVYGITKAFQKINFGGRMAACGPEGYNPPNFINVAKAYEIKTIEVSKNSEIEKKIKELLSSNEAVVMDVNCHEFHTYEPRIFGWKTPIEDMYPYLPREEFKKNMYIEPIEGWETPVMPPKI